MEIRLYSTLAIRSGGRCLLHHRNGWTQERSRRREKFFEVLPGSAPLEEVVSKCGAHPRKVFVSALPCQAMHRRRRHGARHCDRLRRPECDKVGILEQDLHGLFQGGRKDDLARDNSHLDVLDAEGRRWHLPLSSCQFVTGLDTSHRIALPRDRHPINSVSAPQRGGPLTPCALMRSFQAKAETPRFCYR